MKSQKLSAPRWPALSAWCAIVNVAGGQQDDCVEQRNSHRAHRRNCFEVRADRRPLRRIVGPQHAAGQRIAETGTEMFRMKKSAPKNAAKNITSLKMNQLIPQRNDESTFFCRAA